MKSKNGRVWREGFQWKRCTQHKNRITKACWYGVCEEATTSWSLYPSEEVSNYLASTSCDDAIKNKCWYVEVLNCKKKHACHSSQLHQSLD